MLGRKRKAKPREVVRILSLKNLKGVLSKNITLDETRALVEVNNGITSLVDPDPEVSRNRKVSYSFKDSILTRINPSRLKLYLIDKSPIVGIIQISDDQSKKGNLYSEISEYSGKDRYFSENTLISKDGFPVGVSITLSVTLNPDRGETIINMIKDPSLLKEREVLYSKSIWIILDDLICGNILAPLIANEDVSQIRSKYQDINSIAVNQTREQLKNFKESYGLNLTEMALNWHLTPLEKSNNKPSDNLEEIIEILEKQFSFSYSEFFVWLGIILIVFIVALLAILYI